MRILRAALCVALARPCHAEPQCESAACRSADTVRSLLLTYQTLTSGNDEERGLFGRTLPWIEANAIEAVCDYALQAGGLRAGGPGWSRWYFSCTKIAQAPFPIA